MTMRVDANGRNMENHYILISRIPGTNNGEFDDVPLFAVIVYRWERMEWVEDQVMPDFRKETTRLRTVVLDEVGAWGTVDHWRKEYDVAIRDIKRVGT